MSHILICCDPHPDSDEPLFIKKAYIGLRLTPELFFCPGEDAGYPQGVWWVTLEELLRVMNPHNPRAYQWFVENWGDIDEEDEFEDETGILFAFPFGCCEQYEVIH